jgi:hypothetical protein
MYNDDDRTNKKPTDIEQKRANQIYNDALSRLAKSKDGKIVLKQLFLTFYHKVNTANALAMARDIGYSDFALYLKYRLDAIDKRLFFDIISFEE